MTTDDQYVPSEKAVRRAYTYYYDPAIIRRLDHHAAVDAEFDRFLTRVRRDAAREALDGLAEHSDSRDGDGVKGRLGRIIRTWRDTHHPETEDQT